MYPLPNLAVPSGPMVPPPTQTERQFVLDLLNRHNVSFDGTRTRPRGPSSQSSPPVSLKDLRLASLILLRRPELLSQGFLAPFLNLHELGVVLDDDSEEEETPSAEEGESESGESDVTRSSRALETCDLFFIAFVDDVISSLLFRDGPTASGGARETDFRVLSQSEVDNLVGCCQFVRRVVQSLESASASASGSRVVDVRCAVVEFLIRHFSAFVRVVIDAMKIVLGKRQELWDVCESLKKVVVRWTIPREPIRLQLAAIRFVATLIQCFTPLMDHMTAAELKSRETHVGIWAVDHHDGSTQWCGSKERMQLALTDIPLTHDVFKKKRHLLWIDTQMLWKLLRDRLFPSETPLLIVTCVLSCMLSIGKVRRYWWDELVRTLIEYQDVVDRRSQQRRGSVDEDGDAEMGTAEEEEEGGEMMDTDGEAGSESKKTKLSPMQRLSLRTVLKFTFLYLFNIPMVNRRHRSRLVGILTTTYEIPDDYVMMIVGYCENATAPTTGPAVARVRKRKRMAFEETDLVSESRAEQKSKKKPKLDTVSTPLGPKTPLQLAKIVIANLVNIPTPPPPVGTPRPTREAFLQCLFKMCSVLHPAQRSVIQQFSSVQLLPTPEAIAKKAVDTDGDAKMREDSGGAEAVAVPPQPAVQPSLHLTELNVNFEPSLHVEDLGSDEVRGISEITWKKILQADLAQEGCEDFRHSMIVRHVVSCPSEQFVVELINHIKSSLGTRFSLLIRWLYAEFIIVPFRTQTLYDDLFQTFLDYILEKEKWKLKDFVVMAPKLIPGSVEKILSLIFPPNNLPKLGVEILVSLFSTREPLRVTILGLLLNLCFDGNITIRNEAIVAISASVYPVQMYCRFRDSIEEAAHGRLKQLCEPSAPSGELPTDEDGDAIIKDADAETPSSSEALSVDSVVGDLEGGEVQIPEIKKEEEVGGWNRELVKQYCSLAYALATKNHALFDLHVSTAATVQNSTVRAVLLTDVDRLVLRLGPDSPILLRFAATFCEQFNDDEVYQRVLLKALRSRRELPSMELVELVKRHYFERNQNAHLLLPIVTTLTKEQVASAWESMVKSYSREEMEEAMKKLLIPENEIPAVSGADLLIELHRIDCRENDDLFVKVVDASKLLFKIQRMFSSIAIQRVLTAIVSLDRVPRIAMRTVNYAIMNFHDLRRFTMEILSRLVEKPAMWTDKVLFGGIVWCLKREQLHPRVFSVFQKMTVSQVEQVFDHLEDELTRKICEHVRRCLPEGGAWSQMDEEVKKFLLKDEVTI